VKRIAGNMTVIAAALCWAAALAAAGPLRAGAAKVDITPGRPVAPATGKYDHERLYMRAIVLHNGTTRGRWFRWTRGD